MKREKLIEIDKKYQDVDNIELSIKNAINEINLVIDQYQYENDDRFYTYGRRALVIKEFNSNVSENNIKDAFGDLQDIIYCVDFVPLQERDRIIADGLDYEEVLSKMSSYRNDGYICLQEKNIIMDMIIKLKGIMD